MASDVRYPIAEIFFSTQGEGGESGVAMIFIRLAGCTVGKRFPQEMYGPGFTDFPIFVNECTTYDGRKFPCDTDYRAAAKLTAQEIIRTCEALHPVCRVVSITGGEPLMHDIYPLVYELKAAGYRLHLETSGTIPLELDLEKCRAVATCDYVVVSPKFPFIDDYANMADEIRILVDEQFEWDRLPESVRTHANKVWISPVNGLKTVDRENAARCVNIQRTYPMVRVSLQIHKILNVR